MKTVYIKGIPHLTKLRLQKIKKIIKESFHTNFYLNNIFRKRMKKIGYVPLTNNILCNKKLKLIVKWDTYFYGKMPNQAVPTIFIQDPTRKHLHILIQPFVDLKDKRAALSILEEDDPYLYDSTDLHEGNVGWFNNKPVMIDW